MAGLPDWANEPQDQADMPGVTDEALMADIAKAMEARGYTDAEVQEGASALTSTTTTDSGNQPGSTDAPNQGVGAASVAQDQGTQPPGQGSTSTQETTNQPPPPPSGDEMLPTSYKVKLASGDIWEMTQEQANYLLQTHNHIAQQSPQVKEQWRGIEQGTHTAVPQSDFQAYQQWIASGRQTAQPAPTLDAPRPDLSLVDDTTAKYIEYLERNKAPAPTPTPAQQTFTEADVNARVSAQAAVLANQQATFNAGLDQAVTHMKATYALNDAQVARLQQFTSDANIVPGIAASMQTISPTGTVIAHAPTDQVLIQAFEAAMTMEPSLRTIRDTAMVNAAMNKLAPTQIAANQKRANAGVIATMTSASVPSRESDPRKMTAEERHDAMVQEIAQGIDQYQ